MTANFLIWSVSAFSIAGLILRPMGWPEAVWPVAGALLLTILGTLPGSDALRGIAQGCDVYLFLAGMMLLTELAREEGLFDWLAAHAARMAHGSPRRLFGLIYLIGVLVTVFLSNDATAVVLTPAVAAVTRAAGAENRLPFLLICALVANAASFVLPISNPANLVLYGGNMPPLAQWLPRFALPSLLSIAGTWAVLRFTQRRALAGRLRQEIPQAPLSAGGKTAAAGIAGMAALLLLVSGLGLRLGLPTFCAGAVTLAALWVPRRRIPWPVLRQISWSVLPLVAGLFVLVRALAQTGALASLAALMRSLARGNPAGALWGGGIALGYACNLVNNLPAGLAAGEAAAGLPHRVLAGVLLGVDIGPNLSVTGSLATILWLAALRRENIAVTAWQFFRLGLLAMPAALLPALLGLFLS